FVRATEPDANDSRPRHARLWLSRRTDEARRCLKSSIPFLTRVVTNNFVRPGEFPFTLPFLKDGLELLLENFVTFFAGETGERESTLLEAIAGDAGSIPPAATAITLTRGTKRNRVWPLQSSLSGE